MKRLLATTCLTLCAATPAWAQDEAARPADTIRITSSPLGVFSDEIVGTAEVLDSEHIEENLAGSIADTLAHQPGVSTTYFGPASSRPVIRGLGADRVRLLVNGVGLIDASTASPDHAVASEALEARQIEILRGPAAVAYGGGAIGGVVNIIDGRIPEAQPEDGMDGRLYFGATTVDDGVTAAGHVDVGAGPFVLHVDALFREGSDYEIPGFAESAALRALEHDDHADDDHEDDHDEDHDGDHDEAEAFGRVANSGYEFSTASFGASWVGDWGFVGASVKFTDTHYGVPGHAHGEEEHGDHEDDHDDAAPHFAFSEDDDHEEHGEEAVMIDLIQTRYDLRGEYNFDTGFLDRIRFSAGAADYKHVELEGDEIGTVFNNDGYELRTEARHREIGGWTGAAGLQTSRRDFRSAGPEAYVPDTVTEDDGLFLVERYDAGGWGVEAGARFENRDIAAPGASRSFDTQSLSVSGFWRPVPDAFLSLTLSSTERAPTDSELFSDGVHVATRSYLEGDDTLDLEKAISIEFAARAVAGDWAFEAAVFDADYDGFIEAFPTGEEEDGFDVFEYRQVDADLTGFEARADGPLGAAMGWDWSGEILAEYVMSSISGGGDLPRLPPFSATLALEAERGAHTARLEAVFTSDAEEVAAFELPTEGYTLLNASWVARPFGDRDIRIILEGRNLTDEEARLHTSYLKDFLPLPGRGVRMAIAAGF